MKTNQMTILEAFNLLEETSNDTFYHGSNNPNLTKADIITGAQGFHITPDISVANARIQTMYHDCISYLYAVQLNDALQPLTINFDLGQWDALTLAIFFYAKCLHIQPDNGYEYDIDNIDAIIPDDIGDETNAEFFNKIKHTATHNDKEKLIQIINYLKNLGYNSIKYLNMQEGETNTYSYMLFDNSLIKDDPKLIKIFK